MKRYGVQWDGPTSPICTPMPDGHWIWLTDLHAWALRHKATVEKIDCVISGVRCGKCHNCVTRGDALREIEELLK